MTICERIFKIMEQKNMKQKELAEILGIGTNNISNWKNRGTNPPIEYTIDIAKALNISVEWLITGKEMPEIETLSEEEKNLLHYYRKSNQEGKDRIMEQAEFIQSKHPSNLKNFTSESA